MNLTILLNTTHLNVTSEEMLLFIDFWGTPEQFRWIVDITSAVTGCTSFFSSIFVIIYWLHTKENRRKYSLTLVACLACWDMIIEIGHASDHIFSLLYPDLFYQRLCIFFAVLFYYGLVSTWLWTLCIVLNLVWLLYQKPRKRPHRIPIRYLIGGTMGTSGLLTILAGSLGGFGETLTGHGARFCLFVSYQRILDIIFCIIPLSSTWITLTFLYGLVLWRLVHTYHPDLPSQSRTAYTIAIQKSLLYPLIFFFVWCCPYIWANWWFATGESRTIVFLTVFTTNLSGTCNCIGYFVVSHFLDKKQDGAMASSAMQSRRESKINLPSVNASNMVTCT